ncbi:unnamed protein product [Sphagnum balticum]
MSTINLSTSLPKSFMQKELMTRTTSRTYLSRIVSSSSWISNIKDPRFDLNVRIQTQSMEEQTLNAILEALRKDQCIAILDSKSKEAEIDLFFLATSFSPLSLRTLRTKARKESYISVAHDVTCTFGFPFIGEVGCVMLCKDGDDFGALPPEAAKARALGKNILFLIRPNIINVLQGGARS